MTRTTWIIVLVAAGVGLALLIGLLGGCNDDNQQERAVSSLCSSLSSLESDTQSLLSLSPTTASQEDYQSAVQQIENDWSDVEGNLQDVASTTRDELNNDWDSFKQAVDNVPDDATVQESLQDVNQAAQTLSSSTQSTLSAASCS